MHQANLELDVHPGVNRAPHTGNTRTPRSTRQHHGAALASVCTTLWQGVKLVEEIFDTQIKADLFPGIAGTQVGQAITWRFDFVAHVGNIVLAGHRNQFNRLKSPAPVLAKGI